MDEEIKKGERSMLVPFLVGGLLGAGAVLLLAPKTGKAVRKDIKNLAMEARDKVVETVGKGIRLYEDGRMAVKGAIKKGKRVMMEKGEKYLKAA